MGSLKEDCITAIAVLVKALDPLPDRDRSDRIERDPRKVRGGPEDKEHFTGLLTVLFRLLILFMAHDRKLLPVSRDDAKFLASLKSLDSGSDAIPRKRMRYTIWNRLNRLLDVLHSERKRNGAKGDFFFPAGGALFNSVTLGSLRRLRIPDHLMAGAIRSILLASSPDGSGPRDFSACPPETLGYLYENLLPYFPRILTCAPEVRTARTQARDPSRTERRRAGAYFTRRELVEVLVRSALIPALMGKLKREGLPVRARFHPGKGLLEDYAGLTPREKRRSIRLLLDCKVVDPACGGAAFLIAAQDLLARELHRMRTRGLDAKGDSGRAGSRARRDVLLSCLYGVDRDPLALELARVSLWLNTGSRHVPPCALDDRFKCGNALVGAPLVSTVPGEQVTARAECDCWTAALWDPSIIDGKGSAGRRTTKRPSWSRAAKRLPANTAGSLSAEKREAIHRMAADHGFFHWRLEFPSIFECEDPGFDCVLGNPPWERIKLQEREFFAECAAHAARAGSASERRRMIAKLERTDPSLYALYLRRLGESKSFSRFLRRSGRYPLSARGDPNLYLFFAELSRALLSSSGRAGIIVPSGIAFDKGAAAFFRDLIDSRALVGLSDFMNQKRLFPGIAGPNRFCLLTLSGAGDEAPAAKLRFYLESIEDLDDEDRAFTMSPGDFVLLNPNTRTCPPFTSRKDAQRVKKIYRRLPVLVRDAEASTTEGNPWGLRFWSMFHMSGHSHLFRTRDELIRAGAKMKEDRRFEERDATWLRLYESKLMHTLNHRYNTFEGVTSLKREGIKPGTLAVTSEGAMDPAFAVEPRYWVLESKVTEMAEKADWDRKWFPALRSITNVTTNRRSVVAAILPWCGIGNSATVVHTGPSPETAALLMACFSSFAFDYVARTQIGGPNLNFFILKQLPAPPPKSFERDFRGKPLKSFILPRVLELVYTAHDLQAFARDLGFDGPPFAWDEPRREKLQSELDAVFFLMYGMRRSDVDAVLQTFPILKRQEEALSGRFRTRQRILKTYDRIAKQW